MNMDTSLKWKNVHYDTLCVSVWINCKNTMWSDKSELWNDVYNKPFMQTWKALKTNHNIMCGFTCRKVLQHDEKDVYKTLENFYFCGGVWGREGKDWDRYKGVFYFVKFYTYNKKRPEANVTKFEHLLILGVQVMGFIIFCPVLYLNFFFFSHWKQNLSLKLIARVKEVNKAEGWCEEMSWRLGMWNKRQKRGENWQRGILPHFPRKAPPWQVGRSHRGQGLGLPQLSEAAGAPGSQETTWQTCSALLSVTSGRGVHSLCSTESQGSLPRLPQECQAMPGVWVVFMKETSIPGWKWTENLLGHFESTRQKTFIWVTNSNWNLMNLDGSIWGKRIFQ